MVNHAETLLLGMTRAQLSNAGFAKGDPWIVDEAFEGVRSVPPGVKPVVSALFGGLSSPRDRADRVIDAMSVSLTGDMSRFFDALDGRRTIEYWACPSLLRLGSSRKSVGSFEGDVVRSAVMSSGLFSKTGRLALDSLVPSLRGVFLGSHELATRFSAAIALLAYQLESSRIGGNGA